MTEQRDLAGPGFFDIPSFVATLPETATTLVADRYLSERDSASARVIRVYRPTPPHFHAACDEHLYILSGRATFWIEDPTDIKEIGPGQLVVFPRGMVHSIPEIREHPLVMLSVDTPRREPTDIVFVDPAQGSPETFMQRNAR